MFHRQLATLQNIEEEDGAKEDVHAQVGFFFFSFFFFFIHNTARTLADGKGPFDF